MNKLPWLLLVVMLVIAGAQKWENDLLRTNLANTRLFNEGAEQQVREYARDLDLLRQAVALFPPQQENPLTRNVAAACVANCGQLRVFPLKDPMRVAAITVSGQCATIRLPLAMTVSLPSNPNAVMEPASFCRKTSVLDQVGN